MTQITNQNPPSYNSADSADENNGAPPPYHALSPNLPPPSSLTPSPPSFTISPPLLTNQPPLFNNPSSSFGYQIPPPSYSHCNNFQPHLDNHVSGIVLVDGLRSNDNQEAEPERENSLTILMLYTLAVLSCVVCGFFPGLIFIVLIMLGEKRTTAPIGKKRKYYMMLSLIFSMFSFFFVFVVVSWFGHFMRPMPFGGCRYGVSLNKTCCPVTIPSFMCHHGVMKRSFDGCSVCCTSGACQADVRKTKCGLCENYSTKLDHKGCPECCKEVKNCKRDSYRNIYNCMVCSCGAFDAEACTHAGKQERVDGKTGCRVCCPKCAQSSNIRGRGGCPVCCSEPSCQNTYEDKDGCKVCCGAHVLEKCQENVDTIDNHRCDQCCAGSPANNCAFNNSTRV